ncbi:MAG: TIGR02206 family membrane protein [Anaerolineae bacterium]|nr:MAG: TIGR02206 family membrane protein [Anaerolineae bacterium]
MITYFAKDYTGTPFILFGPGHLLALGVILLINLSFLRIRHNPRLKDAVRIGLALILLVDEISWHVWSLATGTWDIQHHLPLHLCSVFVWLSVWMLWKKHYPIYEFAYFLGIGGALQALLTPDAGIYGFPHYRAFQTFISHGGIVTAAVFMTVAEGYRPRLASLKRVFVWGNVYALGVTLVNFAIGSNYLYTLHKPETASLLDMLGPWPWYLIPVEGIALLMCLLLYTPFAWQDFRARRALRDAR